MQSNLSIPQSGLPSAPDVREVVVAGVWFESEKDNVPKAFQCRLVELLGEKHLTAASKAGVPCYSLVNYKPGVSRGKDGVVTVNAVVLDYDHINAADADYLLHESLKGYAYAVATTFSHLANGPNDICLRVVLLLTRSVTPDEFTLVRGEMVREFGVPADDKAADASRIWYRPACPQASLHRAFITYGNGQPVEPDLALSFAHKYLAECSKTSPSATPVTGGSAELRERLTRIKNSEKAAMLTPLLQGQPFATKGERDDTAWKLLSTIAFIAPKTDVEDLVDLFKPSIASMQAAEPDGALTDNDIRGKAARALAEAAEKRAGSFERGDETEIASALVTKLSTNAKAIFDGSRFYRYEAGPTWVAIEPTELSNIVQGFAGAPIYRLDGPPTHLRINDKTVNGTINLAKAKVAAPGFFATGPVGIAFQNVFVSFTPGGARPPAALAG